ncbi:UNVERIFIED_CONTAM: Myosin-2, partial [Sesamum latifolium]
SRVVQLAQGEWSYHIFNQLCSGAPSDLRGRLRLEKASYYNYVNQSDCLEIQNIDDAQKFHMLMDVGVGRWFDHPPLMSPMLWKHQHNRLCHLRPLLQRMEIFASCYKKKEDGSWSGSREKRSRRHQRMREERASQLTPLEEGGSSAANVTPLEEEQLWTEAAGGRKRGHVFGMGFEALTSYTARPWTKDHRASTSSAASPPEPPVSTQL